MCDLLSVTSESIGYYGKKSDRKISYYAGKGYSTITQYGKLIKEEWMNDGSWIGVVEIPGGLQDEFYTALSGLTHGEVETKLL